LLYYPNTNTLSLLLLFKELQENACSHPPVSLDQEHKADLPEPLPPRPLSDLQLYPGREFTGSYFSPASKSTSFVVMHCKGSLDDAEVKVEFDGLVNLPLTW
jgi:hypothetical protein